MLEAVKGWTPNNKRFLAVALMLTIAAQMLVLATEYLSSVWPLWFGTPIILKTAPIDPRSLFRGNYVRLNYEISTIDQELAGESFKRGEVGYATLRKEGDLYIASGLQKEKPESGLFIRGRVEGEGGRYRMRYGIEAFFMPKEQALQVEKSVRQTARAEVFLLGNGRAAITKVLCDSGEH